MPLSLHTYLASTCLGANYVALAPCDARIMQVRYDFGKQQVKHALLLPPPKGTSVMVAMKKLAAATVSVAMLRGTLVCPMVPAVLEAFDGCTLGMAGMLSLHVMMSSAAMPLGWLSLPMLSPVVSCVPSPDAHSPVTTLEAPRPTWLHDDMCSNSHQNRKKRSG